MVFSACAKKHVLWQSFVWTSAIWSSCSGSVKIDFFYNNFRKFLSPFLFCIYSCVVSCCHIFLVSFQHFYFFLKNWIWQFLFWSDSYCPSASIHFRVIGLLEPIPATVGQGWGTPWMVLQSVTLTFSPIGTISIHKLIWDAYCWTVGGSRTDPCMHMENMKSPQKQVPAEIQTRTFSLWGDSANHYTTMQLFIDLIYSYFACIDFNSIFSCHLQKSNPKLSLV